ncbi:hypothetical protein GLOIN_2v1482524 [Rhizophagus irregularis DAOM 181602=DAOM 197198]|uniref:Uncharacterized protein n=1 Tax=Rhizophagus irregularis (strain DAOM 181602 / DAOM 197198 / MUCL 43194) TaxID=747089 RepID=A0A2P4PLG9_RHIID|nr:hypothetical protein GLOIN_2v1482524 [Rhizophagus irregularis DAOM 181602=DAOM 197198]POG66236.1 hypothetical protein GLOIN_2v1482524 [Rhizophagus irregularis DAOM 181602=DAOM 197198]|eukprot:XP_025173102.1 hypothetical protein GLOIN_2v1482524 [Rhizophagus irregularis DAOM 181602=DAOM 197198]
MGNSDKTQTEKTNDPNSSETKCPYQNSANSPRQNSSASSGQNSSASSVTDPRGTNSTQHTDKKAFTDFQATDEIVLKYDFTDSRKHTTYKAATMLHGLEFVERVIVVRRTKSNVRHHQVFWAYLSLSSTIDRENLDTFDLWNVTPTEVKPEDVLDNVEDDENDNSAPNNSPNQVSTQSTKKSSDTDVELNTIACIIGEQLEPVDFSSKSKQMRALLITNTTGSSSVEAKDTRRSCTRTCSHKKDTRLEQKEADNDTIFIIISPVYADIFSTSSTC